MLILTQVWRNSVLKVHHICSSTAILPAVELRSKHKIREIVSYYFDSGFQIQKGTELLFNALFFTGNTAMQIRLCSWEGRGVEGL